LNTANQVLPEPFLIAMAMKFGTRSVFVKDICDIFASIWGFSGLGHHMLAIKFYPDCLSLLWQQILGQNGLL